ncbi:hypothetical protein AB0D24_04520 [Streptomyces javensis]|uniref:hypothetical protein n=1 Tax=Streptomyces javensis TaxID=114698 RepID=UPI0033CE7DF2
MDETTIYYRYDNGSVAKRVVAGAGEDIPVPDGATVITEEEYTAALAAIEEANEAQRQEEEAQHQAQVRADYDALRALGVPEETARRLTGYTGPDDPEES